MDVTEYFNLHVTTTHAAVAYLDRLQPNESYTRFEWQMFAICCILVSAKFNESEEHVPPLRRLEEITQQALSNDVVLNYELWVLKKLSWKLNVRTPVAFLSAYCKLGYPFALPTGCPALSSEEEENLQSHMVSLSTRCLIQTKFKNIPSTILAAAIVFYARKTAGISPVWLPCMSKTMYHHPCQDDQGWKALEMLCSMESDAETWEELLLAKQDSASNSRLSRMKMLQQRYSNKVSGLDNDENDENAFISEEDVQQQEEEVQEMCDRLQVLLAEASSPNLAAVKAAGACAVDLATDSPGTVTFDF
eukprot:scaffold847_cov172-Ochromonas_danica.AAC.11